MRLGLFADVQTSHDPAEGIHGVASDADRVKLDSLWFQNGMGHDAAVLATLASAASRVSEIGIGVMPAPIRHPLAMAQMAATLQVVSKGRFTLGLGASHRSTLETVFELAPGSPVEDMRQHLDVLLPALGGNAKLRVAPNPPPGVVLGALQSRMLKLAAERTDGSVTWLTGVTALRTHIVPTINRWAADANRDRPRVIAILPVCVTRDVRGAKERVDARLAHTSQLPSYRTMFEKAGVAAPSDIALCGSPEEVREGLGDLADAGISDLVAMILPGSDDEWRATLSVLGAEVAGRGA